MKLKYPALVVVTVMLLGCSGAKEANRASSGQPQASSPSVTTSTEALLGYQDEITAGYMRRHLSVLAADSLEGRGTGSEGLKKAADYLADEYRRLGLKPAGDNGTYFQHFDLTATVRDSIVFETYTIEDGKEKVIERSVSSADETANYARSFGGGDTLKGEVVFAGFGINDPTHDIAHLGSMDLSGKWVLVFQDIPTVVEGDTLINPAINARTRFSVLMGQRGAEGILLIPDATVDEFQQAAMYNQTEYGTPSSMRLAYLDNGSGGGFGGGYNVINPALAAQMLGLEQGVEGLDEVRNRLIENLSDFSPRATGFGLKQTPYTSTKTITTKNVLALYEGADPELKDEVVVMTSHYDHVGIGQPDSTGDAIYNGADDDGSGTVGLLNIARALSRAKAKGVVTERSILFLHVSAEEKGLLGSRYYSDHPVIPIEKTVANINVDMIGRVDPEHEQRGVEEYSYIIGGKIISSQLDSLLQVANRRSGNIELSGRYNDLQDPNQFYRRSDHWNFGRLGVPFVFFFTGVHEDYHRPSDEVHKIRFDKMVEIVRTMYATAVLTANAEKAPGVDNQAFINITKGL